MKKLKEFLDPKASKEKTEQIMKQLMNKKFDAELKKKYADILEDEYKVSRDAALVVGNNSSGKKKFVLTLLAIIGLSTLAFLAYNKWGNSESNADKVQQYLAAHEMTYNQTVRNAGASIEAQRKSAFDAINKKDFDSAIAQFASIGKLNKEDQFYQSFAQLNVGDYTSAKAGFKLLSDALVPEENYLEETQLYYGMCLLALDDATYSTYLTTLSPETWARKQLESIKGD